jgi:hypothetical protein
MLGEGRKQVPVLLLEGQSQISRYAGRYCNLQDCAVRFAFRAGGSDWPAERLCWLTFVPLPASVSQRGQLLAKELQVG